MGCRLAPSDAWDNVWMMTSDVLEFVMTGMLKLDLISVAARPSFTS